MKNIFIVVVVCLILTVALIKSGVDPFLSGMIVMIVNFIMFEILTESKK